MLKLRYMASVLEHGYERVAFAKYLIAMAKFTTEQKNVPYVEIKRELKEALLLLCNKPHGSDDEEEEGD